MATSELGHYVRFDETEFAHRSPMDSGMCRRALGNLDHLADQKSRILVNWPGQGSGYFGRDTSSGFDVDEWNVLWRSTLFDLHLHAEGDTYRVRTAVRVTGNDASNQANFRFGLIPQGSDERAEILAGGANITTADVTQTTYTWEDGAALLYLDERRANQASRRIATVDSIGGAERNVVMLRCYLAVYGKRLSGASGEPRVAGAFAIEYLTP